MSHHRIVFDHVGYQYPNGHKALNDISFEVHHGERVAIVGNNGAGKTTLLLLACGLIEPRSGQIAVGDVPVCDKTVQIIRRTVGIVFQNADDQLFMPTVEEDVAFGAVNMGLPDEEIERRTVASLESVGKLSLRCARPWQLSGGEKKLVSIATVLSMEPSVLLLDEPTANLDWKARRDVIELTKAFDHTILIATHDLELAAEVCPRTIEIEQGRVAADRSTIELLRDRIIAQRCPL